MGESPPPRGAVRLRNYLEKNSYEQAGYNRWTSATSGAGTANSGRKTCWRRPGGRRRSPFN